METFSFEDEEDHENAIWLNSAYSQKIDWVYDAWDVPLRCFMEDNKFSFL